MEFSFEINTIATVGAEVARKASKRKRDSAVKDPGAIKQQKFNNGLPFTANSPSRCDRERVALNDEVETSEQQTPEHDTILTTTSSPRPKRKPLSTVKDQVPSGQQKLDDRSPLSSSTQSKNSVLIEEVETSDRRAPRHSSILTTTSSSQPERKPLSTVEGQVSSKQQKPNDNSLPSTSSQPKTSTLIEEATTSEQQAPKHGSLSQAKRTHLITIEDLKPRKQRKLNGGSPLSISSQPKFSTLTDAKTAEQQAPKHGSSSQAKRTRLITIEDQMPRKQRKLNDGTPLSTSSQSDSSFYFLADVALSNPSSRSPFSSARTSDVSTPSNVTLSNSTSRRSSTPAEANPRKGGRPRADKQYPSQKQLRVRTKLRTNRPVKNKVPFEIWQSILEFCPSEFLLKAVNIAYFKEVLLRNENSWKVARLRQFGHDMPDPPPGISEHKYANLLTGSGCHGCGDKRTRRVYWGFVRRWCDNCLGKNVAQVCISFDVVRNMLTYKFAQDQNLGNGICNEMCGRPCKWKFLPEDRSVYPWCEVRQLASLSVGWGVRGTPCVG